MQYYVINIFHPKKIEQPSDPPKQGPLVLCCILTMAHAWLKNATGEAMDPWMSGYCVAPKSKGSPVPRFPKHCHHLLKWFQWSMIFLSGCPCPRDPDFNFLPMSRNLSDSQFLPNCWLVVSSQSKNIRQLRWLFPILGKIQYVPNLQAPIMVYSLQIGRSKKLKKTNPWRIQAARRGINWTWRQVKPPAWVPNPETKIWLICKRYTNNH